MIKPQGLTLKFEGYGLPGSVLAWGWARLSQRVMVLRQFGVEKTERLEPVEARIDMMVKQQEVDGEFDLRTPTSYTITEYPWRIHRTRHGPTELRYPYLRPTSSEFQNNHSMDLIRVFSIFILNPLITPFLLLSLCHPLSEPSHLIPIFAIVTCLSFILVLENAPIGSMLRTRVLTHIPSYLVFIVLLSLSSRLKNTGPL